MPDPKADTLPNTIRAISTLGDYAVDLAAVGALAYMATGGVPDGVAQTLGAMVVSVAIGKRYLSKQ